MDNLLEILRTSNRYWLRDVLTGAGLTLGTSSAIFIAINTLIDKLRDDITNLPPTVLQYAHLAGFDYAISIILGAVVARSIQDSTRLILLRN